MLKKLNRDPVGPAAFQRVVVSLDLAFAEAVNEYHQALVTGGIQGHPVDTLRELIQIGLSSNPATVIPMVDRRKAFNQMRMYMFRKLGGMFQETLIELRSIARTDGMEDPFPPEGPYGNQIR